MPALKPFSRDHLEFDARRILLAAGTVRELLEKIEATGLPAPAPGLVYVWHSRGKIPYNWLPIIIYTLLKHNLIKPSELFVRQENTK